MLGFPSASLPLAVLMVPVLMCALDSGLLFLSAALWLYGVESILGLHPPLCCAEEEVDSSVESTGSPEAWGGVCYGAGDIAVSHCGDAPISGGPFPAALESSGGRSSASLTLLMPPPRAAALGLQPEPSLWGGRRQLAPGAALALPPPPQHHAKRGAAGGRGSHARAWASSALGAGNSG